MYKDKDLCLLLKIKEINMVEKYLISIDVAKNMSNKYGRKILDKRIDAGIKKYYIKVQKQQEK